MSDRKYIPGVSAPGPRPEPSHAEKVEILRQTIEPFRRGLPTPHNPLGLFLLVDRSGSTSPGDALSLPYTEPDTEMLNQQKLSSSVKTFGNFGFYGACIYGGMMRAASAREYFQLYPDFEHYMHNTMKNIGFGLLVMTAMQNHIAVNYANATKTRSMEELLALIEAGYSLVTTKFMHMKGGDATRTEREAGLFRWREDMPDSGAPKSRIEVVDGGDGLRLCLSTTTPIGKAALCGALHVKDRDGTPLARVIWDRITQVGTQVECLFPQILADTTGV